MYAQELNRQKPGGGARETERQVMACMADGPWVAYHLHYHGKLDRVVLGLVHPVAVSLFRSGSISRFFFVRYALGGPHVRLRLSGVPERRGEIDLAVTHAAEGFFWALPSTASLDAETIHRSNHILLAADPGESGDIAYPDNFLRRASFNPEVERYGGSEAIESSLDLFALSSVEAITFLLRQRRQSRDRWLGSAFSLLLRLAVCWGPRDAEELDSLLSWTAETWGEARGLRDRADLVFARQPAVFCASFRREVEVAAPGPPGWPSRGGTQGALMAGTRLVSSALAERPRYDRLRIGTSQIHVMANRLGLTNSEEIYLSRLLGNSFQALRREKRLQDLLFGGHEAAGEFPAASRPGLRDLLPSALSALCDEAQADPVSL